MDKNHFVTWGFPIDKMFLSAGPCSAESESQVLEAAQALKQCSVSFMRAGIWKPRTRPGSFEGVGMKGLPWLDRARSETGLKVGTEVAEPAHVEACLAFGLDIIWIGARTTTNPFSVQAIADALKGTDIPVLIKNPISPDIGLWIGAIERVANAGIKRLGVIHRGFSSLHENHYRNAPDWKLPIELKRRLPDVPMICDPSHICGKSELIAGVSQEALDLLFEGLMVEVHPNPSAALSDAAQQLTPEQFKQMISKLRLSSEKSDSVEFIQRIEGLRGQVDDLDRSLLALIAKRMTVVREIGQLKQGQNVSTLQPDRWGKIVQNRVKAGSTHSLSEDFVLQLMQAIHEEAIRQQELDRIDW